MKPKNIKVSISNCLSISAILESGTPCNTDKKLCFHAYSDTMKARVLDLIADNPGRIEVEITPDTPKNGEWFE